MYPGESELSEFLENSEEIILTSTTKEFIKICLNWYKSLSRIGLSHKVLVVALDDQSFFILRQENIKCILIPTNMINNTEAEWIENEKKFKPLGPMYLLEKYNANLIHLDTDIYFFKDFLPTLREHSNGYDIVMCSDQRYDFYTPKRIKDRIITVNYDKKSTSDWGLAEQLKYGKKNAAVSYFNQKSKKKILNFIKLHFSDDIIKQFPTGTQDGDLQTMTNSKIILEQSGIKINLLNEFEFPNGSLWSVPYLRDQVKDSCYLIHYNYTSSADPALRQIEKINIMKKFNHWY